jgi:hypothetical protein
VLAGYSESKDLLKLFLAYSLAQWFLVCLIGSDKTQQNLGHQKPLRVAAEL